MAAEPKAKPLKTAKQLAELESQAAAVAWPKTMAECYKLRTELQAQHTSTEDEGDLKEAKILSLSKHIVALQQGLPQVASKSGDYNHQHMSKVLIGMKLDRLVRTNPEIKELIAEKTATEAKLAAVLEAVSAATKLDELQAVIAKL